MSGLTEAGISLRRNHPGEHRTACPECAKMTARNRDDALAVKVEAGGGATWLCHRCAWKGALSGREMPRHYRQAIKAFAPVPEIEKPFPDAAAKLWAQCRPIEPGTVAAVYLEARGCALPHPEGDLRWHPSLRHPDNHAGPALVALVTHAAEIEDDARDCVLPRRMTLHRTWIAPDGSGKAAIDRPRLLWARAGL